ncbi:MAG: PEP-CTERM sorting domain-containing protein [Gemmataceae bacterium]|nr:PEP-CTERM sorting domain-containing protein [Gemmataceae bacterium]
MYNARKVRLLVVFSFVALSLWNAPAQADVMVFTDRTAWEAAVGGIFSEEDFADDTFVPGFTITANEILHTSSTTPSRHYHDTVDDPPTGNNIAVFEFTPDIFGFGGDWNLNPDTPGTGIEVEAVFVGGGSQSVFIDNPSPQVGFNGFFGITSDVAIDRVVLSGGRQGPEFGSAEIFDLDNLVFSTFREPSTVIPEPSSLALCGLGALVLAGYGWRQGRRAKPTAGAAA